MAGNPNESAYLTLIDRDNRRQAIESGAARIEKTKQILSGGMNQRPPPLPPPVASMFPMASMAPPPPMTNQYSRGPYGGLPPLPPPHAPTTFSAFPSSIPSGFFGPPPAMARQSSRDYHRHRSHRYHRAESDTDSDVSNASVNSRLKDIIDRRLREHAPDSVRHIIMDDIIAEMKYYDSKGYHLPKGYDPAKHSIDDNEIKHYQQQVNRERKRKQTNVTVLLGFAATGLSWFCRAMKFDWIKVAKLPEIVREAIDDHEFDEFTEGVGESLRGTVLDHPLCGAAIKFLEKMGQAHQLELEEETDQVKHKDAARDQRGQSWRKSFHKAGQGKRRNTSSDDEHKPEDHSVAKPAKPAPPVPAPTTDMPAPSRSRKTLQNESAISSDTTSSTATDTSFTSTSTPPQKKKPPPEVAA